MRHDGERFAAFVAHELRAPIARQRALVEVALADPDVDVAALRQMGERVVAGCERQRRLVDALLELARSERGPARDERVDLTRALADALRTHDLAGLEVVAVLEPAVTRGNRCLLERLVANLVSNAVRHNVARGRIEAATRRESGLAVLSVVNSGPPIPPGDVARLFRPFVQLGPGSKAAADGVGLGLAVVRAIADAHGATVTARARRGGGLGVEVAFPAPE